jgi:hypothetical protein
MKLEKRIRAIEDALERVEDKELRIVIFFKDDTPEVREAILKEARERFSKRRATSGGPDFITIEFRRNRGDFERPRPPGTEEGDKG